MYVAPKPPNGPKDTKGRFSHKTAFFQGSLLQTENFQRQSGNSFTFLSNSAQMVGGDFSLKLNFVRKENHPLVGSGAHQRFIHGNTTHSLFSGVYPTRSLGAIPLLDRLSKLNHILPHPTPKKPSRPRRLP